MTPGKHTSPIINRGNKYLKTQEWDRLLASLKSDQLLNRLANQALAEHRAGITRPLNVEKL